MQLWSHKAKQDALNQSDEERRQQPSLREMLDNKSKATESDSKDSSGPIPIILCGKTEAIGCGVIEGLKPEYEGEFPRRRIATPPGTGQTRGRPSYETEPKRVLKK